jgi:Uma2 family endonuclease
MTPETQVGLERLSRNPMTAYLATKLLTQLQESLAKRDAFWESVSANQKAEYILGEGIFHSPVLAKHSFVNREICLDLGIYLKQNPVGNFFYEKSMVRFDVNDYEPDIIFYLNEKLKTIKPDTLIHPIPDFIVEILSPSTAKIDRGIKMWDYASHGVGEYWIIDPDRRLAEQYLPSNRFEYSPNVVLHGSGVLKSEVIKGWELDVSKLWLEE